MAMDRLERARDPEVTNKAVILKREFATDAAFEAQSRFQDAEEQADQGRDPFKTRTMDPGDLVSIQEFVDYRKMQKLVERGPPSKRPIKTPRSEMPTVVRYNGKNYLVEGNHRAAWAKLYGEKITVRYLEGK